MPDNQDSTDPSTGFDPRPVRRLVLGSTALLMLLILVLAQLGSVQEFVRLRVLAERPTPALRVTDALVPPGDTMLVYVVNEGLANAHIDRAELHVDRVWKLRRILAGPGGGPPPGGWDVPISAARAPYVVTAPIDRNVPPDGADSVRLVMRPEGNAYFVLMRARLVDAAGEVLAEAPPLLHFFPGRGGTLPTRIHAEQFERLIAAGLDPEESSLQFTRARAEAWSENWERVEEVRSLGVRMSAAATEVIERLSWR